jgi:Ca2+-binding EF-hand superfamily protein
LPGAARIATSAASAAHPASGPAVPQLESKMKKTLTALALGFTLTAFAAQAETKVTDTDGNGTYSREEMKAAYPDLSDAIFVAIDADGNGQIDADELQAARENGTIAK